MYGRANNRSRVIETRSRAIRTKAFVFSMLHSPCPGKRRAVVQLIARVRSLMADGVEGEMRPLLEKQVKATRRQKRGTARRDGVVAVEPRKRGYAR